MPGVLGDFPSTDIQFLVALAALCLVAVFLLRRLPRRRSPRAVGQPASASATIMPATSRFEAVQTVPPAAPAAVPQGGSAIAASAAGAGAAKPKRTRSWFAKVKWAVSLVVVVVGIGSGLMKMYRDGGRMVQGINEMRGGHVATLPGCGDAQTTNVLRTLFREHANVTLTRMENPRQQGATNDVVECVIWLTRSDGLEGNIAYRIERQGASQFVVRITGDAP